MYFPPVFHRLTVTIVAFFYGIVYTVPGVAASRDTDSLARELFNAFSRRDEVSLKKLILSRTDLSYLMKKVKRSVDSKAPGAARNIESTMLGEHIRLIDSDPHFAMSMIRYHRILLSFSKARLRGSEAGIDWSKVRYLRHQQFPRPSRLGVPNVSLRIYFQSNGRVYQLNLLGALKTTRGWSVSDALKWHGPADGKPR